MNANTKGFRTVLLGLLLGFGLQVWQCAPTTIKQETPASDAATGQDKAAADQSSKEQNAPDTSTIDDRAPDTAPQDIPTPDRPTPRDTPVTPDKTSQETPSERIPEQNIPDAPPVTNCKDLRNFETGKSPQKRLYIATNGSDSSGDGSSNKPFASLQRAAKDATPGTAILFRAGSYKGQRVSGLQGTEKAPIWIGSLPGEPMPIFENSSQGLHISKSRYLIVHGLEVRNTRDNGINCDDGGEYNNPTASTHIIFRNLKIHDVGGSGNQDCLKLSGIRNYYVLDSSFSKCGGGGSGSGVDHVGCHKGLIARNQFTDMAGNAIQCKGGSSDIEIYRNTMLRAGMRAINMGGSTGFQFFRPPLSKSTDNAEARNIRAVANVIIGGDTPFAFVGCDACIAMQNTIVNPKRWLMRILQETNSKDGYTFVQSGNGNLFNNLFYFKRSEISTYVNIGPNTKANTFQFRGNLWYAYDAPARSKPTLPSTERAGIHGKDPSLSNVGSNDVRPKTGSPAIGAGISFNRLLGDRDGKCFLAPPTIGAYEAGP